MRRATKELRTKLAGRLDPGKHYTLKRASTLTTVNITALKSASRRGRLGSGTLDHRGKVVYSGDAIAQYVATRIRLGPKSNGTRSRVAPKGRVTRKSKTCLFPTCKATKTQARALCKSHYGSIHRYVKLGLTTWAELEKHGKVGRATKKSAGHVQRWALDFKR